MNLSKIIKKPESIWLLVILTAATILRFYHYGSFSYSNDELSALNRLYYDSFSELVEKGFYVDGHPGGIQVLLWQWVKLFGDTEWAVRLPFVLSGILAVWMGFKVARFMFGTASGLFTSAALAFMQFPLLYSQIARPYGPGMLFCLMLVYFWLKIFFTKNRELRTAKPELRHLIGFTLSAALCMYTHYFSFLFALIVGFTGFAFTRKNNIFQYIGSALMAAFLFIPHIPVTLNHLTYKGVGFWLGIPDKYWIFHHIYYIFDQSVLLLVVFLFTLFLLIYLNRGNPVNLRYRILLVVWFIMPFLIAFFYSIYVSPVLQHPVLIFSFPYFIILIFSYAGDAMDNKRNLLLAFFLSLGLIGTAFTNNYYKKQHFGEFKDIARLTSLWQNQFGDSNMTKAISINNPVYLDYYLNRFSAKAKFEIYDVHGTEGLKKLSEVVRNSTKPYFLYAITKPTPTEGEDIIRSKYPYIIDMKLYGSYSSVILFGKQKGRSYEEAKHLQLYKKFTAGLNSDTLKPGQNESPFTAYKLDSTNEYSQGIEILISDIEVRKPYILEAEADIYSHNGTGESVLVISVETPDGKSLAWKGAASAYVETPERWCRSINTLYIDTDYPASTKLKVYFWNKDKKVVYLRNLQCNVFVLK